MLALNSPLPAFTTCEVYWVVSVVPLVSGPTYLPRTSFETCLRLSDLSPTGSLTILLSDSCASYAVDAP